MRMKLEFEFPDKLLNEIKSNISKDPKYADDIINDNLSIFMGGDYPGGDSLGDALIEEIKKILNIDKLNFSERLRKCFSNTNCYLVIDESGNSEFLSELPKGNSRYSGCEYFKFPSEKLAKEYDRLSKYHDDQLNKHITPSKELKDKLNELINKSIEHSYL